MTPARADRPRDRAGGGKQPDVVPYVEQNRALVLAREALAESLVAALDGISGGVCTGIGSPPSCACHSCVARRALKGGPRE